MPRFVLAGGLDHERAAFAAELADMWNDVPLYCQPYHEPLKVMPIEEVYDIEALQAGSWIVHGNHFTRQQAKMVRYATQVVSIALHGSQIDGSEQHRSILMSRDLITAMATRNKVPNHFIFDNANRVSDECDIGDWHWNALTQMAAFTRSQRLLEHREYLNSLVNKAWQKQNGR